jgi:AraC-like DNA-binding protein
MAFYIGIDGGGTKTTCAVGDEQSLLATANGSGSNVVRLGEQQAKLGLQSAIAQACREASVSPLRVVAACIGAAGATNPDVNAAVKVMARQILPNAEVTVVGDMVIAHEAALSPYYFTRQFTAFVGVPPYRYLIGLRIERAQQLLRETELTVTQICHRVGFNSLSHFTTTFRQHTGVSPSAYRRRRDWEQDVRFSPLTRPLVEQPNKRFTV